MDNSIYNLADIYRNSNYGELDEAKLPYYQERQRWLARSIEGWENGNNYICTSQKQGAEYLCEAEGESRRDLPRHKKGVEDDKLFNDVISGLRQTPVIIPESSECIQGSRLNINEHGSFGIITIHGKLAREVRRKQRPKRNTQGTSGEELTTSIA